MTTQYSALDQTRFIIQKLGLVILAVISLLPLDLTRLYAVLSILFLLFIGRLIRGGKYLDFFLGSLILLLPYLGGHALLSSVLIYLALRISREGLNDASWITPFFLLLLSWTLFTLVLSFNSDSISAYFSSPDPYPVIRNLFAASPPRWFLCFGTMTRVLAVGLLFGFFNSDREARDRVKDGMVYGSFLALFVVMLQITFKFPFLLLNQGKYWASLNRFPGTFSDPNAFGIFVVLFLPLIIGAQHISWRSGFLAIFWSGVAAFSGSRSYFLGLLIYGSLFLYQRSRWAFAVFSLVVLAGICVFSQIDPALWMSDSLPSGISRTLLSFNLDHLQEALFSRVLFWKIGILIFLDHLVFGIGLEYFRHVVPSFTSFSAIGTWIDNANSFYLGILAELGAFGAVTLVYSLRNLKVLDKAPKWTFYSVTCLILLLFFGPHLDFVELSCLFPLILSYRYHFAQQSAGSTLRIFYGLGLIFVGWNCLLQEFGLYGIETGAMGERFRWTSNDTAVWVDCSSDPHLRIRAGGRSDVSQVSGTVTTRFEQLAINVHMGETLDIPVNCNHQSALRVRITCNDPWIPTRNSSTGDPRLLCYQLLREN